MIKNKTKKDKPKLYTQEQFATEFMSMINHIQMDLSQLEYMRWMHGNQEIDMERFYASEGRSIINALIIRGFIKGHILVLPRRKGIIERLRG